MFRKIVGKTDFSVPVKIDCRSLIKRYKMHLEMNHSEHEIESATY